MAPYIFFTLEYVILIWNDTTNIQIYSFQVGASNRLDLHLGVKLFIQNDRKMIDPESVQGPPGYHKTTLNDS